MTPFKWTLLRDAHAELVAQRDRLDAAAAAVAAVLTVADEESAHNDPFPSGNVDSWVRANPNCAIAPAAQEPAPLFIPRARVPVEPAAPAAKKPRQTWDSAAMEALDSQIINIVRDTQPAKPNAVAAAIDGKTSIIRARIQLLVKAGRLVADGATSNRVLRLPIEAQSSQAPSGVEAPEVTADRDAAILALVRRGPKTFDELLRGLTTKPADVSADAFRILVKRSLRRLSMRGQLVDVGDKFKAA